MEKRKQYAIGQHDLCCEHLGIGKSHEDQCDTLFEAILCLEDRNEKLVGLAKELIAMFRVNALRGNIDLKDHELDAHLKPWVDRIAEYDTKKNLGGVSKAWFEKSAEIEGNSCVTTYSIANPIFKNCDNCGEKVEITGLGGAHSGCDYVYGRRGWRQLGVYDG